MFITSAHLYTLFSDCDLHIVAHNGIEKRAHEDLAKK